MSKILIAASGTGGHLFPALYIAEELKKLGDCNIQFCGSGRPLEEKIIGSKGYKVNVIPVVGVSRRGIKGKLEFLLKLPKAIIKTLEIFKSFQPDAVIGVGGYISVLPVLIAKFKKIPTLIHEAEKIPGLANKFLAYFADKASLAYAETTFPRKIKTFYTGQPLNPKLYQVESLKEKDKNNILVLGGSQGAEALDKAMLGIRDFLKANNWNVLHQARKGNVDQLQAAYEKESVNAQVVSFIDDMKTAYQQAALIITRSGANTVRELEVVGRPAILIPLPNAPEQKENAEVFVEKYPFALVLEESSLKDNLINYIEKLACIKVDLEEAKQESAARKIAELIFPPKISAE